ncbi:MAG: UDP-N-acetylmuramoyl-L-alanyl-D-glutamate--2,6-diaminopimelate ligase, partial [Alistipes sp.]|nr:UDP-N-acetylmuramoyl-L-alanyl-D-glutamate--2,6-diaminopimelate ligase [Alistipes sp.]
MKELQQLLAASEVVAWHGSRTTPIEHLTFDSREVTAGSCFFAVEGTQVDGHRFIASAVERGAVAVVCRHLPEERSEAVAYVVVEDVQRVMAEMAAAFYDHPSRELKLVGVTGTNGKTTTATLLYDLVRALGYKAGLISTVIYKIDNRLIES